MRALCAAVLCLTAAFSCNSVAYARLQDLQEAAVAKALEHAADLHDTVIFTLMDGHTAKQLFEPFLRSLKHTSEAKHLIVVCQDNAAFAFCGKLHLPELCLKSTARGSSPYRDERSAFHHESLWRKPAIALAILELGYNVLLLDVDIVTFKPVLSVIDWSQDFMVASDCNRGAHNLTFQGESPNSGVFYAKATPATMRFLLKWLALKGSVPNDQWGLWKALDNTTSAELTHKAWASPHAMASFCCQYCNSLVTALGPRKKEWRTICPKEERDNWVLFHAACITAAFDGSDWHAMHDLDVMKRDALLALWQLQMGYML